MNHDRAMSLTRRAAPAGDVDTVAAIALAAGASRAELDQDLPPALVETLETGPYGRACLAELDRWLQALPV